MDVDYVDRDPATEPINLKGPRGPYVPVLQALPPGQVARIALATLSVSLETARVGFHRASNVLHRPIRTWVTDGYLFVTDANQEESKT